MRQISLLVFLGSILFFTQEAAFSQDLSANIMRRVDAANEYLNKAEEQIRTGKAEHAPAQLKGANDEYDNIFNYYKGSFDPEHPVLVKLKKRIEKIENQLADGTDQKPQSTAPFSTEKAPQTKAAISTGNPAPQTNEQGDLSANIRRRIEEADRRLVWVNQGAAKGERAVGELNRAKGEYDKIFEYYKGSFDPKHPDIIALKNRIESAEQAMNEGFAKKNATAPLESNSAAVEDLPVKMGEDLIAIAGALRTLENRLDTASRSTMPGSYLEGVKDDLKIAKGKFDRFNTTYKGQFDAGHVAYTQIEKRLKNDQNAVSKLEAEAGSAK